MSRFPAMAEADKQKLVQRHYDAYWLNVPIEQQLRHEALIARAAPRDVTTDVKSDAFAAVTEVTVYAPDHPRLLATITGACAAPMPTSSVHRFSRQPMAGAGHDSAATGVF